MRRLFIISLIAAAAVSWIAGCASESKPEPYPINNPGGTSAGHYLRADEFDRLVVEIDYVTGNKPSTANIETMQSFLEFALHKPEGIEIILDQEIDSLTSFYRAYEMAQAEREYRNIFTEGSTLATYVLFLNGKIATTSIGGVVYYNTSMAVFPEFLASVADSLDGVRADELISYVSIHEFGHKLGLVDIGSPMIESHTHASQRSHCSDSTCIMWPRISRKVFENFKTSQTFGLNNFCLQDLRENGGQLN